MQQTACPSLGFFFSYFIFPKKTRSDFESSVQILAVCSCSLSLSQHYMAQQHPVLSGRWPCVPWSCSCSPRGAVHALPALLWHPLLLQGVFCCCCGTLLGCKYLCRSEFVFSAWAAEAVCLSQWVTEHVFQEQINSCANQRALLLYQCPTALPVTFIIGGSWGKDMLPFLPTNNCL